MNFAKNTLQSVDALSHSRVNRMVVTYVHLFQSFHLEGVKVNIYGKQVKWKIPNVDVLTQSILLEELFADDSSFGPETRKVSFYSLVPIDFYEVLQHQQILSRRFEKDHNLVDIWRQRKRIKRQDTSFVRNSMLWQYFPLNYKVDRRANVRIQHQQLSACDLHDP